MHFIIFYYIFVILPKTLVSKIFVDVCLSNESIQNYSESCSRWSILLNNYSWTKDSTSVFQSLHKFAVTLCYSIKTDIKEFFIRDNENLESKILTSKKGRCSKLPGVRSIWYAYQAPPPPKKRRRKKER